MKTKQKFPIGAIVVFVFFTPGKFGGRFCPNQDLPIKLSPPPHTGCSKKADPLVILTITSVNVDRF